MSFVHGKSGSFWLDNSGGTLTDISSYVKDVELSIDIDTVETTTIQNDSKTYIPGTEGSTLSVTLLWNTTIDAHIWGIKSSIVTFAYGPAGSASGSIKYTGECMLTNFTIPTDVGSETQLTISLQCTDDITRTTF